MRIFFWFSCVIHHGRVPGPCSVSARRSVCANVVGNDCKSERVGSSVIELRRSAWKVLIALKKKRPKRRKKTNCKKWKERWEDIVSFQKNAIARVIPPVNSKVELQYSLVAEIGRILRQDWLYIIGSQAPNPQKRICRWMLWRLSVKNVLLDIGDEEYGDPCSGVGFTKCGCTLLGLGLVAEATNYEELMHVSPSADIPPRRNDVVRFADFLCRIYSPVIAKEWEIPGEMVQFY